jgi:hypothetical protein
MVAYAESITAKQPINYYAPKSNETTAFRNLFEEIKSRV